MHSVLKDDGLMATVVPHGVLFRGGGEKEIRSSFVDNDLIEAIIALPENLFYGASIGACILVMRAKGAKPESRRGQSSLSMPITNTIRVEPRTTSVRSILKRSPTPLTPLKPSPATPPSSPMRISRKKTTT